MTHGSILLVSSCQGRCLSARLTACSCANGRTHVQGLSCSRAAIPESAGSCRRSPWSTRTNLLLAQSVKLSSVGGRAFPDAGPLRHFRPSVSVSSRPRFLTLSLIPVKSFPTFSGSWSDFITWTALKIYDYLIDWLKVMLNIYPCIRSSWSNTAALALPGSSRPTQLHYVTLTNNSE